MKMFRNILLVLLVMASAAFAAPSPVVPGPVTDCYVMTTASGTYYLTGDLDCNGSTTWFFAYDDDVIIDLNGYRVFNGTDYGVVIDNAARVTVRDGTIENFRYGVDIDPSPDAVVENLELIGGGGDISVGVNITDSNGTTVQNCNITNYTYGVYADPSDDLLITNNRIYSLYYDSNGCAGVFFDQITNSVVSDNWFNDTGDGVFIMASTNIDVTGNEIYYVDSSKSLRSWGDALALEGNVDDILLQDNIIDNCISGYSIDLDDSFAPEQPANNLQVYDNYFGYDCYTYLDVGENFSFDNIESYDGWYISYINYSTFEDITLSDCDDYMDMEYSNGNSFTNIDIWNITGSDGWYIYESYDNTFNDITIYDIYDSYCLDVDDSDRNVFTDVLLYGCHNPSIFYLDVISDPNNFTGLTIGNGSDRGIIEWQNMLSLDTVDLVDGTNVYLDNSFISLDTGDANAEQLNDTARLTLEVTTCSGLDYYMRDGFPATKDDIIQNGAVFTPAYRSCIGGNLATFEVASFSGYSINESGVVPIAGSSSGGDDRKDLSVSHEIICPDNKVVFTITHSGTEMSGVEIGLARSNPYWFVGEESTDSDGEAEFTLDESGSYRATINKDGYYYMNPYTFDFTLCAGTEPEPEPEPATVEEPEETPEEPEPEVEQPPAEETPPAEPEVEPEPEPEPEPVEETVTEGTDAGATGTEGAGVGAEETEQPEEGGLGWELIIGGLVIVVVIAAAAYWFLMQGSSSRRR